MNESWISFLSERWDFVLTALSIALAIVIGFWQVGRRIGRWEIQLQDALRSIGTLMDSYQFLVGALVKANVLESDKLLNVMDPFQKLSRVNIDDLIRGLSVSGNPMTKDEIVRFTKLLDKADEEKALPYAEAKEAYELAQRLIDKYPERPGLEDAKKFLAFILGKASVKVTP